MAMKKTGTPVPVTVVSDFPNQIVIEEVTDEQLTTTQQALEEAENDPITPHVPWLKAQDLKAHAPADIPVRVPIPKDMVEYLLTLISPPPPHPPALFLGELEEVDFEKVRKVPDNTLTGILVRGTPTEQQSQELHRVLRPGAHLLLIAPDTQPTGHTGTCNVEDAGFEIRDSILWVREAGRLHYVPKASRSEREAGCEVLPARTIPLTADEQQELDRLQAMDGDDLSEEEQARLEELTEKASTELNVRNHHPCLHPDALVLTVDGYRPIREVVEGDLVYAADGKFHRVEDVSSHPYSHPHLFEIKVRGTNYSTLASNNHPFLIWRPTRKRNAITGGEVVWAPAEELKVGDYTMTPISTLAGRKDDEYTKQQGRKSSRPMTVTHEGIVHTLRQIKSITHVPYTGDVWNLTVEGSHTFQTAVGMSHNTIKPKDLMERLLGDVPVIRGKPVLDPFHGSGTTGISTLSTGHDFMGIDREPEYVQIATARTHHWKNKLLDGMSGVAVLNERGNINIESDTVLPEREVDVDLFDW